MLSLNGVPRTFGRDCSFSMLLFLSICYLTLFLLGPEVGNITPSSAVDGVEKLDETEENTTPDKGGIIPSLDELEREYVDIAHYKIFQLAGNDVLSFPCLIN